MAMKKMKLLLPFVLSLAFLGAGCSVYHTVNVNTSANVSTGVNGGY